MSQQIYVARKLVFQNPANIRGNIDGPPIPIVKVFDCGFTADASEQDWVSTTGSNGLTLSHSSTDGGEELMTLGSVNDDCGEFYHTAQWSAASNCGMLAKLKINRITNICVCAGMVDAYENTNDHVAMEISGTAAYNCSNTADFAGLVFDTDATTDVWYCTYSEDGTEATPFAATGSLTPTANTYFYAGIKTDSDGDVDFLYGTTLENITIVGHYADAIAAASTDLLTPYIGLISRTTSAATCYISRIITWQDN